MAKKTNKTSAMQLVLIVLVLAVIVFILAFSFLRNSFSPCIGIIKVEGPIAYSSGSFLSPSASVDNLISLFDRADKDPKVKAILMVVNSPGGSAAASKELFDRVASERKPVVAYFEDVAASGGYYISSPAVFIVSNPNTITGSIGARATLINYHSLFEKLGIKEETIKSGKMKDIGSGYRNMTPEERKIFENLVNETFLNFENDVKKARGSKLNLSLFSQITDARILTASQAKKIGLIDAVGNESSAFKKAREMGKINTTSKCIFEPKKGLLGILSQLAFSIGNGIGYALNSNSLLEYR